MDGEIHQLWSFRLEQGSTQRVRGYQTQHNSSKALSTKGTQESFWITACYNPSWSTEEPNKRGPEVHTQEKNAGKVTHHQAKLPHNEVTSFVSLLRVCAKSKDLYRGTELHDDISKRGLLENCSDALVTMYAKCGALDKAKELLDLYKSKDLIAWTALISGYARHGQNQDALNCFKRMKQEGISPDAVTFSCILKVCGNLKAADKGKQIHDEIVRQGLLGNDVVLGTALVDMYAKCADLANAQRVLKELPFRNVVSWSALITGYAQEGQGEQALHCFQEMRHEGFSPDVVTFSCVLKACGTIGAVEKGEKIHEEIARQGLLDNNIVLGTALVDMYAKCGALAKAQQVLEELPSRNVVSWSALIGGYAQQDQGEQALKCFEQMLCEGVSPNAVTFANVLKACGSIGDIEKGEQIHDEITRQGLLKNNIILGTALVDMYVKCGALAKARRVLEELPSRDVVSWSTLITGYVQQGQGEQALNCFKQMLHEGLSPDAVTFSCILNACSHLGLVEEAHMYFVNMSTKYSVKPCLEHYTCMVDLFGRAGHLDKAVRIIEEMPFSDHAAVLSALLGACRKWGDVKVGRWAFEKVIQIDRSDGATYVLMADIYAAAGMQADAKYIEAMRIANSTIQ